MASQHENRASTFRFMLRASHYRNYRLFFGGQVVSLIGTWLTSVASSWLVYRLSRDADEPAALMLGLVGFASQIPVFLLAPVAGVWVDRWNKHSILVATQTLSMLQSFTLAALALSDLISIEQLLVLNLLQGMVNAWDVPARQALGGRTDRGPQRPEQRHRAQLIDDAHGAAGRAGRGRLSDLRIRRRVVLSDRRLQLPGRDRGAAGHAAAKGRAGGHHDAGLGRVFRRAAICLRLSPDSHAAAAGGGDQPGGNVAVDLDADLRRHGLGGRRADTGLLARLRRSGR